MRSTRQRMGMRMATGEEPGFGQPATQTPSSSHMWSIQKELILRLLRGKRVLLY